MNRTEHLLTILAEECAEVAKRCSKALRFGLEERQQNQDLTNSERLTQEMADLMGTFVLLVEETDVVAPTNDSIERKRGRIEKYLALSKAQGTLQ